MNIHAAIPEMVDTNMTSKGQVLIPKALRDRAGLRVNGPVRVGLNDRGEIIVLPALREETPDERMMRVRAAIQSVRGSIDTGFATTNDYMDFIRPHRREEP